MTPRTPAQLAHLHAADEIRKAKHLEAGHESCKRCNGRGWLDTPVEDGVCFRCYGRGWTPSKAERAAIRERVFELVVARMTADLDAYVAESKVEIARCRQAVERDETRARAHSRDPERASKTSRERLARCVEGRRSIFIQQRDRLRAVRSSPSTFRVSITWHRREILAVMRERGLIG